MKITMLEDTKGYNDVNGINETFVTEYTKDETYDVGELLAATLIDSGKAKLADKVIETAVTGPTETKPTKPFAKKAKK